MFFSGSLLVVFSLFCYAVCFLERINSLSLSHCIRKVYMLLLEGSEMLSSY